MNRWRVVLISVVVAALAGGFVWTQFLRGDDDPAPRPTEESPADPTPEASPTSQAVVGPDLTGEDFTRIVADVLSFLDRLSENPDPDRVGDVYAHRCPCYEERRKGLTELRDSGYRYVSAHTEVLSVKRTSGVGATNRVVLEVIAREEASVVVDAQGEVVDELKATPPTRYTFVLVRKTPEAAWRVTTLVRIGPAKQEEGG